MGRKKFVAGNWKMYTTAPLARELAKGVVQGLAGETRVAVAVCPPFPWLTAVAEVLRGSTVELGGQNCYPAPEGAFTGETSPGMLVAAGCKYVIVGHSERRHGLGESDDFLNRKALAALEVGLSVIFCVGETLAEREEGRTESVLQRQIDGGLANVPSGRSSQLVLAYEPVWAIGTGRNATPEQAQDAHAFLRRRMAAHFGEETAGRLPIQYGGSVKPDNAAAILNQPDVDGALVGGASLKVDSFLAIVNAARG